MVKVHCPRCGSECVVDNIDFTRWECGSTRKSFYDGHRTDTDLMFLCEDPAEAVRALADEPWQIE